MLIHFNTFSGVLYDYPSARMRSEGYSSRLYVCLSVCLSTTILALQATRRLI